MKAIRIIMTVVAILFTTTVVAQDRLGPKETLTVLQDYGYRSTANATVVSGKIVDWHESGALFDFDDYVRVKSGINEAWWSSTIRTRDIGYFYATDFPEVRIAHLTSPERVCEIIEDDFVFSESRITDLAEEGDIIIFHNIETGYYAAFRIVDIHFYGDSTFNALADIDWYLQEDGTANFGPCLEESSLHMFPDSGTYTTRTRFDLNLTVETEEGVSVEEEFGLAIFDGEDITNYFKKHLIKETLLTGGVSYRYPNLRGGFLGAGIHTLEITVDLSDGSSLKSIATWDIRE